MQHYDQNQYVEIFYRLPAEIKDMVAASATTEHLWKIGQKHSLHIDKIGVMTDIAFDVMMGIVASKNFAKELQNELQISALDASVLARDIDENVFKPIKEIMVRTYGDAAPNKPSSSLVTITEDEEDHAVLDKDALLKEIENPSEVVVKVEKSEEAKKQESEDIRAETKELETADEVKELREMEKKANITLGVSSIEGSIESARGGVSSFDRLADIKLSQATIMPRGGEEAIRSTEAGKLEGLEEQKLPKPEVKPEYVPRPAATTSTPTPSQPKTYTTDPYREPIS